MVRLKQAPANRFVRQQEVEAFIALFPGCCVIHQDAELRACLYDTLIRMVEQVPVGGIGMQTRWGGSPVMSEHVTSNRQIEINY